MIEIIYRIKSYIKKWRSLFKIKLEVLTMKEYIISELSYEKLIVELPLRIYVQKKRNRILSISLFFC